jgi:hypothetical protein
MTITAGAAESTQEQLTAAIATRKNCHARKLSADSARRLEQQADGGELRKRQ